MLLHFAGHKKHANHLFMLVWWTFLDCIILSGGARGRNRTGMGGLSPRDFKSLVSTYFTTRAIEVSDRWRRGSESNRRRRLCRPLHDHSATPPLLHNFYMSCKPYGKKPVIGYPISDNKITFHKSHFLRKMERETRLELATPTLARLCSTTELFPQYEVAVRLVSLQKQRVDYRDAVRFVKKMRDDC